MTLLQLIEGACKHVVELLTADFGGLALRASADLMMLSKRCRCNLTAHKRKKRARRERAAFFCPPPRNDPSLNAARRSSVVVALFADARTS